MAGNFWDNYGDDVIGLGLAYWMQQQNNRTPNQYPVRLTPEQKYWDEEKKKLHQNSPTRDFINNAGTQFLSQIGGGPPSGMKFMSQELGGQPFAGGFTAPKLDLSQALGQWWKPAPSTSNPRAAGGGAGPRVGNSANPELRPGPQQRQEVGDGFGMFGRDIYDHLSQSPRASAGTADMYGQNQQGPPNGMSYDHGDPGGVRDRAAQISDWWAQYKAQHPNLAGIGLSGVAVALTAAFGLPGALAAKIAGELLSREKPAPPPVNQTPPANGQPPNPGWTP